MIEKELYFIRHGQTDHNKKGIVQGKGVNLPLNELGQRQARGFFEMYKGVQFDKIYTSTLLRAQETIYPFRELGFDFEPRPELDEISWGAMEGNATVMENSDDFRNLTDQWKAGNDHAKPQGGESPHDLQTRQLHFIEHLKTQPYKTILVSMHGRAIRCMMCTLTGTPLRLMEDFPHVNLSLYKVNLLQGGKFEIEKFNDTTHLENI
ncbi:MAG: histidine phosphatase family protein [Bacteroidetes bacterium]|nr:histidine phosphatase family protein [Bacteroidota bacterium]